jgi:hypothetical protein
MLLQTLGPDILPGSSNWGTQNGIRINWQKRLTHKFLIPLATPHDELLNMHEILILLYGNWYAIEVLWNPLVLPDICVRPIINSLDQPGLEDLPSCQD